MAHFADVLKSWNVNLQFKFSRFSSAYMVQVVINVKAIVSRLILITEISVASSLPESPEPKKTHSDSTHSEILESVTTLGMSA